MQFFMDGDVAAYREFAGGRIGASGAIKVGRAVDTFSSDTFTS